MFSLPRSTFAALFAASLLLVPAVAFAQGGDAKPGEAKPGDKPAQAQADAGAQRRAEELAEAAKQVSGPAGHAECVWLGRRVVRWLYNDDLDTAVRHLDLYDRFGCPGPHIQSAFRCIIRQPGISPTQKNQQELNDRVHACWLNPGSGTATAAAPGGAQASSQAAPQAPAAATQGAAPPAGAQTPQGAKPPGTGSR